MPYTDAVTVLHSACFAALSLGSFRVLWGLLRVWWAYQDKKFVEKLLGGGEEGGGGGLGYRGQTRKTTLSHITKAVSHASPVS